MEQNPPTPMRYPPNVVMQPIQGSTVIQPSLNAQQIQGTAQGFRQPAPTPFSNEIITRQKLQELMAQINPNLKLDTEVEEVNQKE